MSISIPNIRYPHEDFISIDTMDTKMKNVLDAWLKYGTVFLIYRLCTYFFFERDNPNAVFFEKESLQLVLFILIGFTVYYLLVEPYVPINVQHPILRNIANDSLMFGTVLITSHVLETYMTDGRFFNNDWLKTAGIILLAFATYRVLVQPFIPLDRLNPNIQPIVSDWAQFGTFLVAFRLLQGKSIADEKWILSVLFVLLGFTGYHLITKKLVDVNQSNQPTNQMPPIQA